MLNRAKYMRSHPTDAERRMWAILRNRRLVDYKFKRQQMIGSYIVDFVNFERRVIVETDGSQHTENEYDQRRDAWLRSQGFTVLRFWNNDALARTEQVSNAIWHALQVPE